MMVELDALIGPYLKRYPGEWLFFELVGADQNDWPTLVHFVAHHPNRDRLTDIALEMDLKRSLVRYAGETVPKGMAAIL